MNDQSRESRLRREAKRQGLRLLKCRCRDRSAPEYGRFNLFDPTRGVHVAGCSPRDYSFTLDDVEAWLASRAATSAPDELGSHF